MAVSGISSNYYNNYSYNGYSSLNTSWKENAEAEADKLKEELGIGSTDKTEKPSSSTSSSSTSGSNKTATTASNASGFLRGYQTALEDLESSSKKLQIYEKDNVFSKLDAVMNKAANGQATDEDVKKAQDNVISAVQDFVKDYNYAVDYLKQNVEHGSGVSNQLEALQRGIPNEKTLKALGMSVDKNGRLQVDEDGLREALEKDPEEVKWLIGGQYGMADRVGNKATSSLDSSVVSILGNDAPEAEEIKKATSNSTTYGSAKKQSTMSDSFLQFASFAKGGAYNLSNYYAVSMLNILV